MGRTAALLYNAAGDRGLALRWNRNELPCFTVWRNTGAVETQLYAAPVVEPMPGGRRVYLAAGLSNAVTTSARLFCLEDED